jgi:hypothetical protein
MEEPCARWPRTPDASFRQWQGRLASTTTVGLLTAARVLGLGPDQARDLAARGAFPCSVITTADGYRVSFVALVHLVKNRGPSSADDEDT